MKSADDFAFGVAAGAAVLIGAFGLLQENSAPRRAPVLPLMSPAGIPRPVPVPAGVRAAADRRSALLAEGAGFWPSFATGVVVHTLFSDLGRLPSDGDGPQFHWILGSGGSFVATARLGAGKAAAPPNVPAEIGAVVLHAAIVGDPGPDPARRQRVRDLWAFAVERFGAAAVRFDFEVPGSTCGPPPDFDPADWVAAPIEPGRKGAR